MSDLREFRDYATDDGEEFWHVRLAHAVEALHGELRSWPIVRTLNPTTGEICQGSLMHLVDTIAEAAVAGQTIRVEPVLTEEPPAKRFDPMSDPAYDPDHVTPGGSP